MIDCEFLEKYDICIHPVLKKRGGRRCVYSKKQKLEEWRCSFRLPGTEKEENKT